MVLPYCHDCIVEDNDQITVLLGGHANVEESVIIGGIQQKKFRN